MRGRLATSIISRPEHHKATTIPSDYTYRRLTRCNRRSLYRLITTSRIDIVDTMRQNGYHNGSSPIINETPMGTQRPLKVIFMGMGASGINFAYQLAKRTTGIELVIYEKNVRRVASQHRWSMHLLAIFLGPRRWYMVRKSVRWLCLRYSKCLLSVHVVCCCR